MKGYCRAALAAVLLGVSVGVAADPSPVRVPTAPVDPPPAPPPGTPIRLDADLIYAVDSDVPFKIFASPEGLVRVTKEPGPLRVRGQFVGGSGVETRTFAGKYLAFVEPVPGARGDAELIILPDSAKDESAAIRPRLRVNGGTIPDPQPPPGPNPEPVSKAAWVVVVEETEQRTPAVASVLNDLAYWKSLTPRGLGWRFYDQNSPDAKAKKYDQITKDKDGREVPLPRLILLDRDGKDPLTGGKPVASPLPATTAGIDALLKGVSP